MTDPRESTEHAADGVPPTAADAVTDASMAPMDDDAGGPTADRDETPEPSEEEAAAQLGDFA